MKNTSVTLGDHFDHFVAEALANGRYRSALLEGEQSGFVNFSLEELNRELDATLGS